MDTDHAFAELGLAPSATEDEVKAAWRRLVSQWHPDRNGNTGAVARMQRINDAFRVIRRSGFSVKPGPARHAESHTAPHAESRGAQARHSHEGFAQAGAPRDDAEPAADSASHTQRRTVNRKVRLTLEEAAAGCTKVLQGKVTDTCSSCSGRGFRLPGGPCAGCDGAGEIRQAAWFGWVNASSSCEACGGSGESRLACQDCGETGKLEARRYQISVRIPHGVRSGDLLHVDGRRMRSGQASVDLHLRIELMPHELFELDDDGTLRCEMPVDGFAWIGNRSITVPTLNGPQTLQLSRDRLSYRLDQQGFPVDRRGPRGDQLVTVQPIFPERLSTDQDILLDQLIAASSGPDGQAVDERLRAWHHDLRTWEQGRRPRDPGRR